mmetsp:Transcript_162109/g.519835  ORF Transcript_162109/g.519835 Transcript_162109/m.519835 type:complete len:204 (-) Transcript_162109:105-716(-)
MSQLAGSTPLVPLGGLGDTLQPPRSRGPRMRELPDGHEAARPWHRHLPSSSQWSQDARALLGRPQPHLLSGPLGQLPEQPQGGIPAESDLPPAAVFQRSGGSRHDEPVRCVSPESAHRPASHKVRHSRQLREDNRNDASILDDAMRAAAASAVPAASCRAARGGAPCEDECVHRRPQLHHRELARRSRAARGGLLAEPPERGR